MRSRVRSSLAVLTLIITLPLATCLQLAHDDSDGLRLSGRSKFALSRLFDFASYKRSFNKSYSSVLEDLMRQKLFWPRAFRALISGVKYKAKQATHYLAINQMSDMTAEELQRMTDDAHEIHEPSLAYKRPEAGSHEQPEEGDLSFGQTADLEQDLLMYVRARPNEPTAVELRQQIISDELIDLPIDELIDNDAKVKLDEESEQKRVDEVASSGAGSSGSGGEPALPSSLTVSQWQRVQFRSVGPESQASAPKLRRHTGFRKRWAQLRRAISGGSGAQAKPGPDELFLDLRETKCFDLARFQGGCGACWAFVMVSILEWLYCMKSGKLVQFSEQYMIDCGYDNIDTLDGCDGGNPLAAASFVRNFGIELRKSWPYAMREHECPFRRDTPLERTGYFRFPLARGLSVHLARVPEQLKSGPLYVSVMVARDFAEFGGGVHGFGCSSIYGRHAMTLVGHGRQDGLEYWLLRNTYGPAWGEDGYYKLAKAAQCIMPPQAYAYGTTDQLNATDYFRVNEFRDETLVQRHHDMMMSHETSRQSAPT